MVAVTEQSGASASLKKAVGRGGFFTLGFGAMVGSGWVVVLGDWLRIAGPGGTIVGFLAGAIVMVLTCLCYGELAARFSTAGAEFLYALKTFGTRAGFLVGWFLTLFAVSICSFEAIACAWLLRGLIPQIGLGTAYTVAGAPVTWDALFIGLGGALTIGGLHFRGAKSAIAFQNIATYGFIIVSAGLIVAGCTLGTSRHLKPLWETGGGGSWVVGSSWIFATCAMFLNSWQTALHALEERCSSVTIGKVVSSMVAAIIAGSAFYIGIVIAAASAVPWKELVGGELPAVVAFRGLGLDGVLGTIVLVAAIVSLFKTWSAMTWIGSRLLFAQARHGLLPRYLGVVDPLSGAPRAGVMVITFFAIVGLALGRAAILPIVDMVSICLALSLVFCLVVLIRRRSQDSGKPSYTVPGGTTTIVLALLGTIAMIGIALVQPLIQNRGHVPVEWILLCAWGLLGLITWILSSRSRRDDKSGYVEAVSTSNVTPCANGTSRP